MNPKYDIVDVLNKPYEFYPGNFETAMRANAFYAGLCQEAADEITKLRKHEWQGLTDDEVIKVYGEAVATVNASWDGTGQVGLIFPIAIYKEYERILKEKNA